VARSTALPGSVHPADLHPADRDIGSVPERDAARRSVLAVSWCCSVGATWTLELHPVCYGSDDSALKGPVLDWISSGVPTELPAPESDTVDMLAERDLQLFPDVVPVEQVPRTRSRRLAGYATRDGEVMRLALWIAEILEGDDPAADDPADDPAADARAADEADDDDPADDEAGVPDAGRPHPMPLAGRWIEAGFSVKAAAEWVRAGVFSPQLARSFMCTDLDRPAPSGWWRAG
jgi:hypothetical protein